MLSKLWTDLSGKRFFLVPTSAVLPSGNLDITTALGNRRSVDKTVLVPFEISREEAQNWLMQHTGDLLERAGDSFLEALQKNLQKAQEDIAEIEQSKQETTTAEGSVYSVEWNDLLKRLAELYGQQCDDDVTAVLRGTHLLLTEIFSIMRDAGSSDRCCRQQSVIRAERLEVLMNDLNLPTQGMISELPAKIEELIRNSKESTAQHDPSDALDRLAETIESNAASVVERLRQAAIELRNTGKATD
jgi:hypothetical protein